MFGEPWTPALREDPQSTIKYLSMKDKIDSSL